MEAQKQVCTIEQGRKLVSLGLCKESYFCYCGSLIDSEPFVVLQTDYVYSDCSSFYYHNRVPAFTVSEMSLMLGKGTPEAELFHNVVLRKVNAGHSLTIALCAEFVAETIIGGLMGGELCVQVLNKRLLHESTLAEAENLVYDGAFAD